MNCIITEGKLGKPFRILAEHFNVGIPKLEEITYKYRSITGNDESFPTDVFIQNELGELPYVESSEMLDNAKKLWDKKYSKPLSFDSVEEVMQAKALAESCFPKDAVHVYENNQGKQVLKVQEPVGKMPVKYRKDFSSWQEYEDYLKIMGDLIPESERQNERTLNTLQFSITSPKTFTFKDGVTVSVPFKPNEQQVEALNSMSDFINSDETSMTLSGYAGTGKTSLMEIIAAKMKKQRRNIVFSASTNKAAAVLRDRVQKAGFTAQTLNKVFGIQVEVDSSKPYDASNLVNKLKEAEITPGTIVVIDEASMINEENYAILNGIARDNDLKIIYVGDKGQLAPVGESQISKVFRDNNRRMVTLTKVERTDDNAILKEATAIRNGKPLSGESSFNKEGKGVAYIKPTNKAGIKAIVERFVPILRNNPDYFRILAYTNKAVSDYNTAVRNALGYYDNTPRVGEPIVGYNNWGSEYDRRTRQTTYRFINSESYKVIDVKPEKQVSYQLDNGTVVTMTAIPITIEDAMGKKEKIDLMDIKGNSQNLQATTILAKEKARLFDKARHLPRKEQPAVYSQINAIEKFLFVNDNIMEGGRKLQNKVFDFGYAMTVHKSQGSTFTHVLVDDADIATAKDRTLSSNDSAVSMVNPYEDLQNQMPVDLGMDSASSDMQATSQGNLLSALSQSQPAPLNAETINRQANNVANIRQQLEYVAVSRATDTVTVISNNVKSEDTPLNHLPKNTVQSGSAPLTTSVPEISHMCFDKQEALQYKKQLMEQGIDEKYIKIERFADEDTDYWMVSTIQPAAQPSAIENTPKPVQQMNSKELWEHLESIAEPMGERPVSYTPVGKTRQQYIVKDGKVYNKKGEEVHYQGKDINRILANLAVAEDRGVVVTYRDKDYVVDNHQTITSVTSGDIMKWGAENGDRKAIIQLAEQKFKTLIENRQNRLSEMVPELMDLLKAQGINIHDKAAMEKFLKENPQWSTKIQQFIGKKARTQFEQQLMKARPDLVTPRYIVNGIDFIEDPFSDDFIPNKLDAATAQRLQKEGIIKEGVFSTWALTDKGKEMAQVSHPEIDATLDFLHSLEDNKENTAYIKTAIRWIANRSLTLPQDHTKAYQAFDLARKKHLDLQKYSTLGELITSPEMQPKEKEKAPFNPDKAKTFSNKRTVTTEGGRVFTVYDVEDTDKGQREVCKALAAHYEMSPWCLSTFTSKGEPTESAKRYWAEYDGIPRKIAFENGKPVAFSSAKSIINENFQSYSLEGLPLYRDSHGEFDVTGGNREKIQELIKRGLITEGLLDNYRVTEKGKAHISKYEQPKEAWWDMEDARPQDTLSDSIVSDYRTPEQRERAIEAARDQAVQEQYEEYLRTGFPEPVNPIQEELYDLPFFITPEGEVYGFADPKGDLYFDEEKVSPNVQIHEYTHLWDRAVAQRNPKLWKRGVDLMKQTSLWNEVLNDANYGQKWKAMKEMTPEKMESLIASEVHSRLTGTQGETLLNRIAKEKGSKGIVAKLKQWILDFWKELKGTFSNWSDEEINNLTLDDFNKMTVRDLVDKVNLKEQPTVQNGSAILSTGTINQNNNRSNNQTVYSNDFRRVQETVRRGGSRTLGKEGIGQDASERLGGLLQRELASKSSFGSLGTRVLTHDKTGTKFTIHEQVDPQLFHDIFEVVRYYTHNGELVDLHDDYTNCKCYLNEDGTCGFAIEPDGNLISVFNLGAKKGFLSAIAQYAIEQGATHLDAFDSSKQPLKTIYEKTLGAKVASSMDYNMEFDHDNIAANHGNPQVVFMVMGEAAKGNVEERHFNKDQYDEAQAYQLSFVQQSSTPNFIPHPIQMSNFGIVTGERVIQVDQAWKEPILLELDDQLDIDHFDSEENAQVVAQINRVQTASSQEEYEKAPTKQQEETNTRMADYVKRNQQLNNLLENKVGLKASEIRETAETIVNTLSDIITEIQQNPEKAKEYWPTLKSNRDISKASRKEIVGEIIGVDRLMALAKKRFDDLKWSEDPAIDALYNSTNLLDQHDLIMDNWEAIMRFAGDIFTANEGFGIKRDSKKGNYQVEEREYVGYDYDDYSSPQDQDAIAEEEDEQEHWQVEAKTIDVINSMSELVRMAIHNCYVLDRNGNKVLDKWGMPKRVDKHKAVKQILYWTSGTLNINEMIDRLEAHKDRNPWVTQLTKRLADKSGKEADFQSQFYGVMHRHFQLYGIGQYENGHYIHKILNRHNALSEVLKGISAQFQMHQHPLFNRDSTINKENLNKLEGWYNELEALRKKYNLMMIKSSGEGSREEYVSSNDLELSTADMETAARAISAASRMLGFVTTEENILPIINKDSLFRMTNALMLILDRDGLKAQAQSGKKDYQPFEFKKENNIRGALTKFLQPMIEELEETALNTIFEDGKMYQSNTIPSFLSQLFDSFAQSEENFKPWVESFYGNSEWFKTRDGRWRTPWLAIMMENPEARKAFEHHVQLNFNKHNYMRNMSPDEYILSCFTNYFFNATNEKAPDTTPAWFRVPLQSNKPSSEFIKFYSYRGADYKDKIVSAMQEFFLQELDRIDTVRKRNKQEGSDSAITSWDEHGRHFVALPFLNSYLMDNGKLVEEQGNDLFRNPDGTVDTQKNKELESLLNEKVNAEEMMLPEKEERLRILVKEATYAYMQNLANELLDEYEQNGILKAAEKIENIRDYNRSIRENIENFLWNDFFAANNILQLTITDQAFYPTTAELSKRLAELHAPGTKANKLATDYEGNRVSDGNYRTILINDYENFTASIIDNLTEIFNRKIEQAPKDEKAAWEDLKESLVGKDGRYRRINVTDGQGYSSPASYRKKMLMFGKWSPEAEEAYNRIRSGNFTLDDLNVAFQPLKPFVYGHLHKNTGVQNAPIQQMNVPFQAKNSEYLLIMADALMQGQETGRPNLLKVIYEVMEESEKLFPTKGIDTVQFGSAIKSGAQGVIDIGRYTLSPTGEAEARTALRDSMYVRNDKGEIVDYNYDTYVHSTDYDNYALQQEVPKHFQEHMQAEPSQKRANIMSDLDMWKNPQGDRNNPDNINYYTWKDPDGTEHKLNAQEFRKEYEKVHAQNIEESLEELSELFHLNSNDKLERNIALSELLQEEIESSPRYGVDLLQACQIDPETGDFRIPKGDPVQSKRIEQLINSIIKSRVNKQKLAGGPIVQATNWGTSRQLHIRFSDRQGNLLPTKEEYESSAKYATLSQQKSYQKFIKENQAGIAHFEIFAPASWKKHLEKFRNPDGTINMEAIEACDPNLLRMITSRIPNEDKYSIAHGKIVGFMPEVAGEVIMFPYELTEIDDSDFDVDKRYCHVFEIEDIVEDTPKVKRLLFDTVSDSYKRSHDGAEMSYNMKKKVNDSINMLLDNPEVMRHTDKFLESLYNAYQNILHTKFPYKVKYPRKGTRKDRNNQILNMDWAVMSNEMTASKILNPGGFDIPKHDAYVIAVYRAKDGKMQWEKLDAMTTKQLQKLMPPAGNLAWFKTHVQFYKQNAAGSTLIGIFAVNKVAHALLEADDILIDVEEICGDETAFTLAGTDFIGRMPLDPSQDSNGAYIGKALGSMVGASADTAKDPWLDLIGINKTTSAVYNALLRLGMPQKDAALFMSQDALVSVLSEFNRTNLEEPTTLDAVISKRMTALSSKYGFTENSTVNYEPLTREELKEGLLPARNLSDVAKVEKDKIDYKVLMAFSKLQNLAKAIRKPTLATRLNSISSAVGPLIIDNIILEHKLMQFLESENEEGTGFYSSDGSSVDIDDIFYNHPMLRAFERAIDYARLLFMDMPAGSTAFKQLLDSLPASIKDKIYDDRQLLSKLSDFYQSYMLVASGIVKPENIGNYIKGFPQYFVKENFKEKYPDNAFIQAIQLTFNKKSDRGFLNINTTGMMEQEKEKLRMAWTDLHKQNPELSTQLFTYAFFRGGIGFSPKTWMGLVSTYVKEHLDVTKADGSQTSYVDTYRHFPTDSMVDDIVIEQFIRNNWDNSKLVPKKGGEDTTYDYSHLSEGSLWVHAKKDKEALEGLQYMRTDIDKKTYLWKRVTPMEDKESSIEFKRIMPLGNNGEYMEMSLKADMNAMETVEELKTNNDQQELPENSSKDAASDGQDSAPVTPQQSVTQQAKSIAELVPLVMRMHNISEKAAVDYLESLKTKALNNTVSKFSKQDIQRMAKENGLNLDVEKALEWFKKLC